MQSALTTHHWITTLWHDISGNLQEQPPSYHVPALLNGYNNLPAFLEDFCFLYYHKHMSLQQVAKTLHISQQLAHQRRVVSIALFRILLAAKPKNPV
jgi:hypothetical protein